MSIIQPNPGDTLGADNHALMHRVFAIDSAAPNESVVVNASGQATTLSDIILGGALYFGDQLTDGTWRIILSGLNLSIQLRQGGIWVEKNSITP